MTLEELLALVEQAEAGLAELSANDLGELRDSLFAGYQAVRPSVTDDEGVQALTRVAQAIASVDLALGTLEPEEPLAPSAEVDEALAALDAAVQPQQVREEDVIILGGPEGGTDLAEHAVGDPVPSNPEPEPEPAPAKKGKQAVTTRPSLASLSLAVPEQPVAEVELPHWRMTASASLPGLTAGSDMNVEQLGKALKRMHPAMQVIPNVEGLDPESVTMGADGNQHGVGGQKHYVGEIEIAKRPGVVEYTNEGPEVIDRAVREFVQARDERDAHNVRMIASGGNCVMAQPDWSIHVLGDRGTCFTDNLPTVTGPRPLAYYPWLEINQSVGATGAGSMPASGIGFVTEPQDRAGYGSVGGTPDAIPSGGTTYKSCIHIDCPATPLTCDVEAVYKCVTVGNFQATSHPEYVDAFQTYMDIWLDIERDNRALAKVVAQATGNSHVIRHDELTFGAVSSLKDVLARFVAHERSAHHAPNLTFNVIPPDWFASYLTTDILRHTFGSIDNLRATPAQARALASTDGINIGQSYCTEPGVTSGASAQEMVLAPIGATIPAWPSRARLLIYPDGAVFKKVGPSLSFGLRETLMKTNDFGMFMELTENVCFRSGRVWVLDIALCLNGATGAPVALTCT